MFVLNGALFGIWASRIPAVADRHDLELRCAGRPLLLLLAAGAILAFPLAGRATDRFGAYWVTWRVAIAYTLSLFLIALAPGTVTLAVALFFFGAVHGAMDVTMNTWAGEVERRMGRPVMSSFHAMFSLGAGLGAGSGFLAGHAGLSIEMHFFVAGAAFSRSWRWRWHPSNGRPIRAGRRRHRRFLPGPRAPFWPSAWWLSARRWAKEPWPTGAPSFSF